MKTVFILESLKDGTLFKSAVKAHHIPQCDNIYYCNYKFTGRDYLIWIIIDINTGLILHMNENMVKMLEDFKVFKTYSMIQSMRLNDPTYQDKIRIFENALLADEEIRWG